VAGIFLAMMAVIGVGFSVHVGSAVPFMMVLGLGCMTVLFFLAIHSVLTVLVETVVAFWHQLPGDEEV
jgi:hypothetical protein